MHGDLCCHCTRCWFSHGTRTTTCVFFSHFWFLSLTSQHCVHQSWNLHLRWRCHNWPIVSRFISSILHHLRICYLRWHSNQRKELLWATPHWSIPPSSNWSIWMFTQTCQCVFTWMCQCYLELEKVKKPSLFLSWLFFSIKNFNYIAKDATIFHLKSSNSGRPSYFSMSIPLGHTPITLVDLLQVVGCWDGEFLTLGLY
jgi:hypothetical protein